MAERGERYWRADDVKAFEPDSADSLSGAVGHLAFPPPARV
jgi:hypothetical protein